MSRPRSVAAPAILQSSTLWDSLRSHGTCFLSETLDFRTLCTAPFDGTVLTPALAWEAIKREDYRGCFDDALQELMAESSSKVGSYQDLTARLLKLYVFHLGITIMQCVPDRDHYTFIDPFFSDNTDMIIQEATELIQIFTSRGFDSTNIVISIPATKEGLIAAKMLHDQYGIRANMVMVSSLLHAIISGDTGAAAVTYDFQALRQLCPVQCDQEAEVIAAIRNTGALFQLHCKPKLVVTGLNHIKQLRSMAGPFTCCLGDAIATEALSTTSPADYCSLNPAELQAPKETVGILGRDAQSSGRQLMSLLPTDMCALAQKAFVSGMTPMKICLQQVRIVLTEEFLRHQRQRLAQANRPKGDDDHPRMLISDAHCSERRSRDSMTKSEGGPRKSKGKDALRKVTFAIGTKD